MPTTGWWPTARPNEVASLELGLKNVTLQRTKDGYFVGSNFPINEKLPTEETKFDAERHERSAPMRAMSAGTQLMEREQGQDRRRRRPALPGGPLRHLQTRRTIRTSARCAATSISRRAGCEPWQPPYGIAGAVQNKVADAAMAEKMSFTAAAGHACGLHFRAAQQLKEHPEFAWQKELLHDMDSRPWTTFRVSN